MQILYIWDSDYPWDVRVEKICMSLKRNGYDVHIAARNLKKQPQYEQIKGLHIHRLQPFQRDSINSLLSFPAFFSPVWKRFLDDIISRQEIKVIIVRDLPLAIAGIWAGKRHGIPVIFDMAEDYVAMIQDIWRKRKFSGLNLLVRNPYLARYVEKYVFKNIDHILVVIDEAIETVIKGGGSQEKVTIVGNTPPLSSFKKYEIQMNKNLQLIEGHFSAIYIGGIQMGRGIQTVLDAIPEIAEKIPNFLFVVIGDGYATNQLKKIINGRQLQDHVMWLGWLDHKNIFDYIKASKIGLIPHFVTNHVNTTIPNKLFDYMGCGIPVVASDASPIKRILQEENAGLIFRSGDASDLAYAIKKIYKSDINYGLNGMLSVKSKYNWEVDSTRLNMLIGQLVNDSQIALR